MTTAQTWPVLHAPDHWRAVDVISDLHLQPGEPGTFDAWQRYMAGTPADAVFMLGDLFEVWVGDDAVIDHPDSGDQTNSFESRCVRVIHSASQRLDVFMMHGNRDFLMGPALMTQCSAQLLHDPTTLEFADQRWLLTHGDALCLDDTAYMQFRAQVRSDAWQQAFLAKPLEERKAIARDLRSQSEARKRTSSKEDYADVDTATAINWLESAGATTMIHGHTHKPADHDLGEGLQRVVLSDWDVSARPPRAEVLRLSVDPAAPMRRLPLLPVTA
jgi:UDP-2,3-diacylglucosamine hydrolase